MTDPEMKRCPFATVIPCRAKVILFSATAVTPQDQTSHCQTRLGQ